MNCDFDLAIVGSGFSGSLLAMIAKRLGRSVILIERGSHPRFAIGESSTPLANLLLEEIATEYDLPRLRPLCEWGSWQQTFPDVACGLKRGFTFYHHQFDQPWSRRPDRANELLVAASPHDAVADTHWYRADFDFLLVREAQAFGVEYVDGTELTSVASWNGGWQLEGKRQQQSVSLRAKLIIDASGPRGFLHNQFRLPSTRFADLPHIEALYSHFTGVRRWDELMPCVGAPYPPDDAAVHHVWPGGWIWILRFNNQITSAGVAAVAGREHYLSDRKGWETLLRRLPAIEALFREAQPVMPFAHSENLPFRSQTAAGQNWALLPSAAGFVDPLLSTGFPLTLLGVQRLARILKGGDIAAQLRSYETQTFRELDRAAQLIAALYHNMDRPRVFNALTLLYFAAASFTETARRLDRPELAGETFLLGDHPTFAPAFQHCIQLALRAAPVEEIIKSVLTAVASVDVAGLSDFSRRNSYGVFASDLRAAAPKLGVTVAAIDAMLSRLGMLPA